MSCTTQETRSIAERFGSAPNCCYPVTSNVTARCAISLARSLSKPLPRQERRAIGLHPLTVIGSRLGFGTKRTSASLKQDGWVPSLMQARKRVPTNGLIVFQQLRRSSTEIPSAPGAVLAQPMVHMRISSSETWSFHGIRLVLGASSGGCDGNRVGCE